MASDDQANPFDQPSHWPRLRQGPIRLGPLPKAVPWPAGWEHDQPPRTVPEPEAVAQARATEIVPPAPEAPAAPTPIHAPIQTHARPELADSDFAIPLPAPAALVIPFGARRTRLQVRRTSALVPILAACVVGLAGVGLLAYLMNAGQQAAAPATTPIRLAPPPPAALPVAQAPAAAPLEAAAPVETAAAAPAPPPTRPASAPVRTAAIGPPPRKAAIIAGPPAPTLDMPDPAPRRISLPAQPPPEPAAAPATRVHPSDPDAPISTNTPN